jgi:16S rRNA (uracil1498-N3)-methyltransferase
MTASAPNRMFHAGPLAAGDMLRLDAPTSHHALRVLRLTQADPLELFNGDGLRYPARLLDLDPRGASVTLGDPVDAGTESPLRIGLAQALPAGDKMDWVVEKAVELGVSAIQPLYTQRSLLRLEGDRAERRLAHWRRIAVAACMQCGRDRLPSVSAPVPLLRWLALDPGRPSDAPAPAGPKPSPVAPSAGGAAPAPLRLVLSPRGTGGLAGIDAAATTVWLLAGPEGGFTDDEDAAAVAAGWHPMRLGPRTLRTETAGLAALAALQARFGDY